MLLCAGEKPGWFTRTDVGPSLGVSLVTWQPRPGIRPGEEVLLRGRGHKRSKAAASPISVRPHGCWEDAGEKPSQLTEVTWGRLAQGGLRVSGRGPCFKLGEGEATGGLKGTDGSQSEGLCAPGGRNSMCKGPEMGLQGRRCQAREGDTRGSQARGERWAGNRESGWKFLGEWPQGRTQERERA